VVLAESGSGQRTGLETGAPRRKREGRAEWGSGEERSDIFRLLCILIIGMSTITANTTAVG